MNGNKGLLKQTKVTDLEFEILDALYFTVSFKQLQKDVSTEERLLKDSIISLMEKGWVKCLDIASEDEVDINKVNEGFNKFNFLATKEGLLAHNSR